MISLSFVEPGQDAVRSQESGLRMAKPVSQFCPTIPTAIGPWAVTFALQKMGQRVETRGLSVQTSSVSLREGFRECLCNRELGLTSHSLPESLGFSQPNHRSGEQQAIRCV